MMGPGENAVRLLAVGDICLKTKDGGNPFANAGDLLRRKDILFGNLETVIGERGAEARKAVPLWVPAERAGFLRSAGFNLVSVANNHVTDRGWQGVVDTVEALGVNDVGCIGVRINRDDQTSLVTVKNGLRLGFLAYCEYGFNDKRQGIAVPGIRTAEICADIRSIRDRCDIVVISMHWGIEKTFHPSPRQIRIAHELIDAGACVILGHHPHVVQGLERYKNGLVAYSLGNFQFDPDIGNHEQVLRNAVSQGMALSVMMSGKGPLSYEIIPVEINKNGVPSEAHGEEAQRILSRVSELSRSIGIKPASRLQWMEQISEPYIDDSIRSWKLRVRKYGIGQVLLFVRWLMSPFVLGCCLILIRQKMLSRKRARFQLADETGRTEAPETIKVG